MLCGTVLQSLLFICGLLCALYLSHTRNNIGSWVHPGEYASSGRYQDSYIYGFIYVTCKYIKHQLITVSA